MADRRDPYTPLHLDAQEDEEPDLTALAAEAAARYARVQSQADRQKARGTAPVDRPEGAASEVSEEPLEPSGEPAPGPAEAAAPPDERLTTLEMALAEEQRRAQEYLDHLRRMKAEFENFRKRTLRDQTRMLEMANRDIIVKLLPTVDDLERAIAAARTPAAELGAAGQALKEGLELVHRQLVEMLRREGLTRLEAEGRRFDPETHEAVGMVATDAHPEDTVVAVVQAGYQLRDDLLRPARVLVAKAPNDGDLRGVRPEEQGVPEAGEDAGS